MSFVRAALRLLCLAFIVLSGNALGASAQQVTYEVAFSNAVHHEAEITAIWTGVPLRKPLEVRMSRSSPGRYALHEFVKNVYNVQATEEKGRPLAIHNPDPYGWIISGHHGTVKLHYTLYGDHADGTYAGIDAAHAHLNGPATFAWARGYDKRPVSVTIHPPPGQSIATQLFPTADSTVFTAPTLDYLMDSPIEVGPVSIRSWEMRSGDTTLTIRVALHHAGTEAETDAYSKMIAATVDEEEGMFGELPKFETGRYTFLIDYLPTVFGDGMEHRNSTSVTGSRPISTNAVDNIGTVAHEFFHCWNVKRIRPKSLEPFDYERANMSGELWLAEGFTNYYGHLALVRSGLESFDRFVRGEAGNLSGVINSPGRRYNSLVAMSEQAPLVDAATSIDETNRANTFISYYSFGQAVALGLDLTLRERYHGVTLDSLMRLLWRRHGRVMKPYTNRDVQNALAVVTADTAFAEQFFDRYIYGRQLMAYDSLLAQAGLTLRKAKPGSAWLGPVYLRSEDGKAVLTGATIVQTPLYEAGLDRRDKIISIDSIPIAGQKDFDSVLALHKPGEHSVLEFDQRGLRKSAIITYGGNPDLEIVAAESTTTSPTAAMLSLRHKWLASKSLKPLPQLRKYCPICKKDYPFTDEICPDDKSPLKITP